MPTFTKQTVAVAAQALRRHVDNALMARAHAELKREAVDKIERQILSERPYMADQSLTKGPPERITDPKLGYLICEPDWTDYHAKVKAIHLANGYTPAAEGKCPALVAENLQRQAEDVLIEAAEEFFPEITKDKLLCMPNSLEQLQKYIDLLVGLVVNAPGYVKRSPQEWLAMCKTYEEDNPETCPDCNAPTNGVVPPYCPKHDGEYSSWLARNNID